MEIEGSFHDESGEVGSERDVLVRAKLHRQQIAVLDERLVNLSGQ